MFLDYAMVNRRFGHCHMSIQTRVASMPWVGQYVVTSRDILPGAWGKLLCGSNCPGGGGGGIIINGEGTTDGDREAQGYGAGGGAYGPDGQSGVVIIYVWIHETIWSSNLYSFMWFIKFSVIKRNSFVLLYRDFCLVNQFIKNHQLNKAEIGATDESISVWISGSQYTFFSTYSSLHFSTLLLNNAFINTVRRLYFETLEVRFILSLTFQKLSLAFSLGYLSQVFINFNNLWQFWNPHDNQISNLSLIFEFADKFTEIIHIEKDEYKINFWKISTVFNLKYLNQNFIKLSI